MRDTDHAEYLKTIFWLNRSVYGGDWQKFLDDLKDRSRMSHYHHEVAANIKRDISWITNTMPQHLDGEE